MGSSWSSSQEKVPAQPEIRNPQRYALQSAEGILTGIPSQFDRGRPAEPARSALKRWSLWIQISGFPNSHNQTCPKCVCGHDDYSPIGRIQTTRPLLPLICRIARRPRIGPKAWPSGALNAHRPRIRPKVWPCGTLNAHRPRMTPEAWPGGVNDGSGPRIRPKVWPSRGIYWSGPPFAANPWPTTEYPLRRSASHRNNSSRCGWNELPIP